jgi:amidophosphoribosyltransferase
VGSCFYGVDTPTREELIAHTHTLAEIQGFLKADSLRYLELGSMHRVMERPAGEYCDACFSGNYPISVDQAQMEHQLDLFFVDENEDTSTD